MIRDKTVQNASPHALLTTPSSHPRPRARKKRSHQAHGSGCPLMSHTLAGKERTHARPARHTQDLQNEPISAITYHMLCLYPCPSVCICGSPLSPKKRTHAAPVSHPPLH